MILSCLILLAGSVSLLKNSFLISNRLESSLCLQIDLGIQSWFHDSHFITTPFEPQVKMTFLSTLLQIMPMISCLWPYMICNGFMSLWSKQTNFPFSYWTAIRWSWFKWLSIKWEITFDFYAIDEWNRKLRTITSCLYFLVFTLK